jgi:prepilin-type N-terminal cleavage/methylation domain-containing protein
MRRSFSSPSAPDHCCSRGFSLIELLIVIAAGTVVLAFAVPEMQRSLSASRLQTSATQLAAELNYARTISVSRNASFEVRFNSAERTFQILDTEDPANPPRVAKTLEPGITFASVAGGQVGFFPRGHAQAGVITLTNGFGQRINVVVRSSGMVEVQDFTAAQQ